MQLNCNGLRPKVDNIIHFMESNQINIAALQETNLNDNSNLKTPPGYTTETVNRGPSRGKGGGLGFIIKDGIRFRKIQPAIPAQDKHLEAQSIEVFTGNDNITITNLYIPPHSSCVTGYTPSICQLLNKNTIVVGDFNAHHPLWH